LSEIAQASRTTFEMAREFLSGLTDLENSSNAMLSGSARMKLAREAARFGVIHRAARALTWQEFEEFGEECLCGAGFDTQKGIVIMDSARRWQIDLVALKGEILLTLDCKHWESPNYASKFKSAIEHQKQSLSPLINHLRTKGRLVGPETWTLPIIVTLSEPRDVTLHGVVLVSFEQLPDFLAHLSPYDPELPFVRIDNLAESPIS